MPPEITELTLNWIDLRNIFVGIIFVLAALFLAICAFVIANGESRYEQTRDDRGRIVALTDRELLP